MQPPSRAPPMRVALVVLVLALALALAGCMEIAPPGAPEERAQRAMEAFARDVATGEGDLARLEGGLSSGPYAGSFLIEWSRDGARHVRVAAGPMVIEAYCAPDRAVIVREGVAREARPSACPLRGEALDALPRALDALRLVSATPDGADVVAVFAPNASQPDDARDLGNVTVRVSRSDRVIHIEAATPGGNASLDARYDRKATLVPPTTTGRLAANVEGDEDRDEDSVAWRADDVEDGVALAELEVRLVDASGDALVSFAASGGAQEKDGYALDVTDQDSDGRLDEGDAFTITKDGLSRGDARLVVWDAWAGAPVERQVPAPGVAWALAIVLAVALSRRPRA